MLRNAFCFAWDPKPLCQQKPCLTLVSKQMFQKHHVLHGFLNHCMYQKPCVLQWYLSKCCKQPCVLHGILSHRVKKHMFTQVFKQMLRHCARVASMIPHAPPFRYTFS